MAKNRKAAEKVILELISDIDTSGENTKLYQHVIFPSKSDKAFDEWMQNIESGKEYLPLYYANMHSNGITTKHNLAIAKKWGVNFFQRVNARDPTTGKMTLGPLRHPVFYLPVKRQAQTLLHKRSIATDNRHLDALSHQVAGKMSKASSISNLEMMILVSQGFEDMVLEWAKYRGGDHVAYQMMERQIAETGHANTEALDPYTGQNKAALTVAAVLRACHFDNNLDTNK